MNILQTINNSGILGGILSGIYAVVVFILIVNFVPVKQRLAFFGIFNKWAILVFLLFTFGFLKHEVGYYLSIESSYCKNTGICYDLVNNHQPNSFGRIRSTVGFLENIWLESFGEGLMFILVGLPSFIFINNRYIAAFVTGILGDIFSKYSGFNNLFCKTTCSANLIAL